MIFKICCTRNVESCARTVEIVATRTKSQKKLKLFQHVRKVKIVQSIFVEIIITPARFTIKEVTIVKYFINLSEELSERSYHRIF